MNLIKIYKLLKNVETKVDVTINLQALFA